MQFYYGGYFHDANSVAFESATRTMIRSQNQTGHILRVNWAMKGKIVGNQAYIWSTINLMRTAYSTDGLTAGMLDNSGNSTPFTINSAASLGGIRVINPISHGPIEGAEGNTYLRYKFALEADFPYAFANDILSWAETLSFSNNDGGPIFIERIPARGRPILQQVTEKSWYYATQQGSMTQAGPNPTPATFVFDQAYLRTANGTAQQVTYSSPKTIKNRPIEYGVQWRYEYISADPLIGQPTAQPY